MDFQQFLPPAPLRPYVRRFWVLNHADDVPYRLRIIVDGCPGLLFQQAEGGVCDEENKCWPALLLHGQATKSTHIRVGGRFRLVGATLHPGAEALAFNLPAAELTDTCLDLAAWPGRAAATTAALQESQSAAEQLRHLTDFLLATVAAGVRAPDPAVQLALAQLQATEGQVSMAVLRQCAQLSERSLQRRFQQYVGVSPQLFGRICRFQATLGQLRAASYDKLSDLAFNNEYADQSHHIRVFREFAGVSPRQHLHHAQELLDNLALS
jgi:AraC-like DNA-binding protein